MFPKFCKILYIGWWRFLSGKLNDEADSAYSLIKIDLQNERIIYHRNQSSYQLPPKPCVRPFKPVWERNGSLKENVLKLLKVLLKSYKKGRHWNTFLFDLSLVLFQRIWLKVKIVQLRSRMSWIRFTWQITSIQKKEIMPNCSWRSLSQVQLRFTKMSFLVIIIWIFLPRVFKRLW